MISCPLNLPPSVSGCYPWQVLRDHKYSSRPRTRLVLVLKLCWDQDQYLVLTNQVLIFNINTKSLAELLVLRDHQSCWDQDQDLSGFEYFDQDQYLVLTTQVLRSISRVLLNSPLPGYLLCITRSKNCKSGIGLSCQTVEILTFTNFIDS